MRMVRVYVGVFVVCLCLGLAFVALTPQKAAAVPSWCNMTDCYIDWECQEDCSNPKCPVCNYVDRAYRWKSDIECTGPADCFRWEHFACAFCNQ